MQPITLAIQSLDHMRVRADPSDTLHHRTPKFANHANLAHAGSRLIVLVAELDDLWFSMRVSNSRMFCQCVSSSSLLTLENLFGQPPKAPVKLLS